ncbi:phosphotransferase [Actinomadura harenae]|uniref:Phosphotransferase n=1 Tax=Actinomadura harenae TaxID=2483351 RepID=A0A3M2LLN5_9ACTN|nr:phosphotransferase [Actinomadura harenae]RMI38344.1 phosphotransferase [Actinomadura harenae]
MTPSANWRKPYRDSASCAAAAAHHAWWAALGAPVPTLHTVGPRELVFERVPGRHALPGDLPALAELLGRLHRGAYVAELHRARLDRPFRTADGTVIPDFLHRRLDALDRLLHDREVPSTGLTFGQATGVIYAALDGPACLYKDSNPRNFLISPSGPVLVDFDALTLAPAGYDLAKLLVTLVMTHGQLPTAPIREALTVYNSALTHPPCDLRPVRWADLMHWATFHHILTSPYQGRGGYRHRWTPYELEIAPSQEPGFPP